jgi:hypothetical protein
MDAIAADIKEAMSHCIGIAQNQFEVSAPIVRDSEIYSIIYDSIC